MMYGTLGLAVLIFVIVLLVLVVRQMTVQEAGKPPMPQVLWWVLCVILAIVIALLWRGQLHVS